MGLLAVGLLVPACSGDDDSRAGAGEATSDDGDLAAPGDIITAAGETSMPVPVTTLVPRVPGPMPSSSDGVPALTPEVSYPALVVDAEIEIVLAPPTVGNPTPRIRFVEDGSLLVMDEIARTVNAYGVDGPVRWSVPLPVDVEGDRPLQMDLGPERVLYVSYRRADNTFVLTAIATSGERGGQVLATWPTSRECVESFCGDVVLGPEGVALGGFGAFDAARYVDAAGVVSDVTYVVPARAEITQQPGPVMPADWLSTDEFGNVLGSSRTTVSLGPRSWVFDVMGVRQTEGTYAFFDAQVDGSVVSTFALTDNIEGPGQLVWLDLLPDGSVSAFRLPTEAMSISAARVVDGQRYVVVQTGDRLRLLRLVIAG